MSLIRTGARRKLFGALLCTLSLVACGPAPEGESTGDAPPTGTDKKPVVYGTDDRMDVYAHPDATLRARAQQATVALMNPSDFNATNPNNVTFNASTLRSAYNLCSTERFLDDLTPAFCSGTLIDDDLVLTAGHCITSASACTNTRFVFNFYRTAAGAMQTVTTADIFSCQSIVVRQQATVNGRNLDYAILRLDRAATPRFTPAPVRAGNSAMAAGANVTVIGSGSGIPFKIDSGGSVRDARASTLDYFVASTDTFGGNSGSGVYEMSGYTVAGILVRGETDYVSNGSCSIVNVCAESGCRGEDITYVWPAVEAYCAVATSERLCTGLPPPPPPPANSFTYTASSTNNATTNTTNKVVALTAGQKITVATCGLTGSTFTGDTWLRLNGPAGSEVASNDDACSGRGSSLSFTATTAGNYEIRAGCYSSGSCGGTVVWTIETGTPPPTGGGSFAYSGSNTNSAQQNTTNRDITLSAGQVITYGTCNVTGASGTGDTYLRLYNASGTQVSFNDDGSGCGTLSYATYTVPAGAGGTYQLRAGCYSSNSCSGTVAWTIQ
ncbi:serine protease [Myxococcus sp. RHSTA-1-4]|uniref:serine protease n=1 Tax=Myxococcus sp. RHSTA-1-4 TaxID=2874601 RepID=UPI001CBE80AE|nr:serine protease [Myxococcus sp. RHSTA-1-4]MBZ4419347.1 trypsin-like peptidase domain-containing protein [Myxococcus sp. RHSTA-1-4]